MVKFHYRISCFESNSRWKVRLVCVGLKQFEMSQVDLGFSEPCEKWKLQSKFFPSKIGGKPAWLDLENVPSGDEVRCAKCNEPMTFLCQIYAPYEEDDNNFHRTLFVFVCRKAECNERNRSEGVKLIRSNLRRDNKFYSYEPPSDEPDPSFSLSKWLSLCEVCGCVGTKKCSKCNAESYCSREHQIIDWKDKHKHTCGKSVNTYLRVSKALFPESEIVIEPEEFDKKEVNEEEEKQKYLELLNQNSGTMMDIDEEELSQFSAEDPDKAFTKFRKRVESSPSQILRYERGGVPLYISNEGIPEEIPNCEYCGGPRQFEFQIMPQILSIIKEQDIDWGVLICYTCVNSCHNDFHYKNECIFKQDVSEVDLNS